jgi:hypothetical protein
MAMTATAGETQRVLERLHELGFVRPAPAPRKEEGGRPTRHWSVNPLLFKRENP